LEIQIRLDDPAWRLVGQKILSIELPGQIHTVGDVIGELGVRFHGLDAELRGDNGDMIPYSLFLNDESVRWVDVDKVNVKQGDRLRVILPIAGGYACIT
jgi:molybdopterin converting factor small subunit